LTVFSLVFHTNDLTRYGGPFVSSFLDSFLDSSGSTPDIYTVSNSVKCERPGVYTITLAKTHGLQDGDRMRLITEKDHNLSAVARVLNDRTFTVETKEPLGDKVFVYGKAVATIQEKENSEVRTVALHQ